MNIKLPSDWNEYEITFKEQHYFPDFSLNGYFNVWLKLAFRMQYEYEFTIDDYTNDLTTRDILQDFVEELPNASRVQLSLFIEPVDDIFRNNTNITADYIFPPRVVDDVNRWWWKRVPKLLGAEILRDIKDMRVKILADKQHLVDKSVKGLKEAELAFAAQRNLPKFNLEEFVSRWNCFSQFLETEYKLTIYDYTNDITLRDIIFDFMTGLPADLRMDAIFAVREADKRFIENTNETDLYVFPSRIVDDPNRWWWRRIPKNLGSDIAQDLKEL